MGVLCGESLHKYLQIGESISLLVASGTFMAGISFAVAAGKALTE